jgi:hypothetical protein
MVHNQMSTMWSVAEIAAELDSWRWAKRVAEKKLQKWVATPAWSAEACVKVDELKASIQEAEEAIAYYESCLED